MRPFLELDVPVPPARLEELREPEEIHWALDQRLPESPGPGVDGMEIRPPPAMPSTRCSQRAATRCFALAAETSDPGRPNVKLNGRSGCLSVGIALGAQNLEVGLTNEARDKRR